MIICFLNHHYTVLHYMFASQNLQLHSFDNKTKHLNIILVRHIIEKQSVK